ncbi:MAG: hypothetical protein IJ752_08095, partial [Alphaproteobacteria bacterium]|nr:hypothetical protein [Alphaproteobacteria bacterium]
KNCDNKDECTSFSCNQGYALNGSVCQKVECDASSSWYVNTNGTINVPSGRSCWTTYGAYANIITPNASYTRVQISMWQYATVNGSFSTEKLWASGVSDNANLRNTITFNDEVTVTGEIGIEEASNSSASNRMGTTLIFNKGLKGSPKCVVQKNRFDRRGTMETNATCACTSSQCSINN